MSKNKVVVERYDNGKVKMVSHFNESDQLHRLSGPAQICWHDNGRKAHELFYVDGKLHRIGEPAWNYWSKSGHKFCEGFYHNGQMHRADGPAYIYWNENGEVTQQRHYIDGEYLTKKQFWQRLKRSRSAITNTKQDSVIKAILNYLVS